MATRKFNNTAYGQSQPLIDTPPQPVVAARAPGANDFAQIGTLWIYEATNSAYILTSIVANVATWEQITFNGGGATFDHLTVVNAFTVEHGPISMTSTVNEANTILIEANGGAADTLTILSNAGTTNTAVNIQAAAGGITLNADTALTLAASATSVWQVTGAANNLTVESAGGTLNLIGDTATNITSEAGNILLSAEGEIELTTSALGSPGNIFIAGAASGVIGGATAITMNTFVGTATFAGLTTASAATVTLTITNSVVTGTTSGIIVTAENLGGNDAKMTVVRVIPAAGSFQVILLNNGAAALNGNLLINFMVINP